MEAVSASPVRRSDPRRPKAATEEVSAFLQVPVATLYQWRHKKQGPPAVRIGKHLRYDWDDVEAWWDAQKADQNP
ncbi:helix-turn-helix transcriptional regulator [Streptomyces sp. NPDC058157]|uniref:helix-turn-helix transcriptional regulator n=1 Tax=Streptomyces sp. NPDC058157 TaxID=3346360 RepID=UPI0036E2D6F7